MSKKSKQLMRRTSDLVESTERLRQSLLRYKKTCAEIVKLGEQGEQGGATVATLERLSVGERRQDVTEHIKEFEAARRRVRRALLAVCIDEDGANLSDVARGLGISRQLASRLAAEAEDHR